jgi:hypothetical protein
MVTFMPQFVPQLAGGKRPQKSFAVNARISPLLCAEISNRG